MSGRPTVITPNVVSLLVASFHSGLTVREACWQSGISHEAYYTRLRSNKQFADIMSRAQAQPTCKAKQVVVEAINNGDIGASKWWLERKVSDEFGRSPDIKVVKPVSKENQFVSMSDAELDAVGIALLHVLQYEYGLNEDISEKLRMSKEQVGHPK